MIVLAVGLRHGGVPRLYATTRAVLELSGFKQPPIAPLMSGPRRDDNVALRLTDDHLHDLVRASRSSKVVVRTHQGPNRLSVGGVLRHVQSGELRIHVVLRDPREIAARMLVNESEKTERTSPSVDAVVKRLRDRLASLRNWCTVASLVVPHADIVSKDGTGARVIERDLGLSHVDDKDLSRRIARRRSRRQSPGPGTRGAATDEQRHQPDRPRSALSVEDAARIELEFGDYIGLVEHGDRDWLGGLA